MAFLIRKTNRPDIPKTGVESLWRGVTPDFKAAFMAIERVEEQLRRFTKALDAAGIPYAIIGGNAVAAWVSTIDPEAIRSTKDVDVLLRRSDLDRAADAVASAGLVREEVLDIPIFVEKENPSPKRAVHVILADEPVRSGCLPAPSVEMAVRSRQGYMVVVLPELVRMKLEANRRHDQVHIEDMLRVGLIDSKLASELPEDLLERLRYVRDTMEWFTARPIF
ncbi:MAG: hypothetical protein HY287_15180 [Planctomycetes bacterium]|nr:hypothetical protein [Planctomycetota bacterium]